MGKKSSREREDYNPHSTEHPYIHLFHTLFLVLVLCRVMRLESFLGHRQKPPWTDGQSITHIHIHTHYSLQFTCAVCLWIVGETQRKPTSTQREHTNSTDSCSSWDSSTVHTAPHYTRLMMFIYFFLVIIASKFIFYYIYIYIYIYKLCICIFIFHK